MNANTCFKTKFSSSLPNHDFQVSKILSIKFEAIIRAENFLEPHQTWQNIFLWEVKNSTLISVMYEYEGCARMKKRDDSRWFPIVVMIQCPHLRVPVFPYTYTSHKTCNLVFSKLSKTSKVPDFLIYENFDLFLILSLSHSKKDWKGWKKKDTRKRRCNEKVSR